MVNLSGQHNFSRRNCYITRQSSNQLQDFDFSHLCPQHLLQPFSSLTFISKPNQSSMQIVMNRTEIQSSPTGSQMQSMLLSYWWPRCNQLETSQVALREVMNENAVRFHEKLTFVIFSITEARQRNLSSQKCIFSKCFSSSKVFSRLQFICHNN